MKILVRETVTHFHCVELSDEFDVEKLMDSCNNIVHRYDSGVDAIQAILEPYKERYGDAFDYKIERDYAGSKCEEVECEDVLEE